MEKEFDVNAFLTEHEEEYDKNPELYNNPVVEDIVPTEVVETVEDGVEEEIEEIEEIEEVEETEENLDTEPEEIEPVVETDGVPEVNDPDIHKRNEAFKQMRIENEKLATQAKFMEELATSYGMTSEELMAKFNEDRAKKEAKASGMSVEQYTRMQELENTVKTLEATRREEKFNVFADAMAVKYNLSDKDFRELGAEATNMGLDLLSNPELLEVAYKALDYDRAVKKGRQAQLEETKRRRETASNLPKGGVVEQNDDDYDAEIDKYLKEQGIT